MLDADDETSLSSGPGKRRVLIMDDDELVCNCLSLLLASMGYRVTVTTDSDSAIAACGQAVDRGEPIDVVILDLHLPSGLSGRETLGRLRSVDPRVKAVVSSGDTTDPCLLEFRKYGFDNALPKPVMYDELQAVLTALAPLSE